MQSRSRKIALIRRHQRRAAPQGGKDGRISGHPGQPEHRLDLGAAFSRGIVHYPVQPQRIGQAQRPLRVARFA